MVRIIFIVALIISVVTGCGESKVQDRTIWMVEECTAGNEIVKKGDAVTFTPGFITFLGDSSSALKYPALVTGERLLINTGTEKMLFNIYKIADSTWTMSELYAINPLIFTITIINQKR